MDSRAESAAAYNVVYEDIEPFFEWHTEDDFHVLVVMLPGFRRDQLKVQVTSTPILKISAQRQIGGNRWRRIYKEFSLPSDSDPNDITAKFEGGTLKFKFPKLITTPSSKSPERDADADKNHATQLSEDQPKPKIDDQVSDKSQEKVEEPATKDDDLTKEEGKADEKNSVHRQEDQEKPKIGGGGEDSSGETHQKEKELEAARDDFSKEKGKIKNGVDEKKAVHGEDLGKSKSGDEVPGKKTPAAEEARDGKKRGKNVSRLKTRLLDFTLSLRPSSSSSSSSSLRAADEHGDSYYDCKEALSDLAARLKKMKNFVNLMVAALLVVAFVLYLKNSFESSLEGSEEYEL